MASKKAAWAAGCVAAAAVAVGLGARAGSPRPPDGAVGEQLARLAASVDRLQRERPAERVVERHTVHEVAHAPAPQPPPSAAGEPAPEPGSPDGFDPADVSAYAQGRGPHPVERRFEREADGGRTAAARQRDLGEAIARAAQGLDADVVSSECRASLCRIEATFGALEDGEALLTRLFMMAEGGQTAVEHGGVYAPVQEAVGDRRHTVFYVLNKPS